ncbi:MAG: rhodanese-like domain-containing protein [Lautropia sp.]
MNFVTENIFLIAIACASGAMLLWPMINRGFGGASLGTLPATRMINDQGAVIVDVRPAAEFANGHLPGARNLPAEDLAKRAGDLPSGKPVIVVCANGSRAGKAAAALRSAGRADVFTLDGGIANWQQAGLPLVKK